MSRLEAEFRPARLRDADDLADNLRDADRRELDALGLADHRAALRESLRRSPLAAAAQDAQGLVALLGVAPLMDTVLAPVGAPWMMGVPRSYRHARTLVRWGPIYTRAMLAAYPRLMNIVHEENTLHVGWIRRLGFTFRPDPVLTATGARFLVFEMSK